MSVSNLKTLIGKLNATCRGALESAAGLCMSHTHYEVDLEHFLIKLLDLKDTDFHKILRHFEINADRLTADLTRAIEGFKTGNARTPVFSPQIPRMIQDAWMISSIEYGDELVRSGHIVLALLNGEQTARMLISDSDSLKKIKVETLQENLMDIVKGSAEDSEAAQAAAAPGAPEKGGKPVGTKALDQFTINLTAQAKAGKIDPVLGRDFEVRQMVDILIRRRQNNPILTGEAGVGKTAVVEGFAMRVAEGDVPPALAGVEIRSLDLGLLQAGAGVKGEFENRLKSVISEVKGSPTPIILFIDEAHTLIGAGGSGAGDAANLLKPALARGELRTIAATTWAEYKKYFEKDAALARRFQVVKVEEPDEEKALVMMRGVAPFLENHHKVMITDEALESTVRLSHRYISGRQLPDKAVSVLDTACARVAIGLTTSPPAVEEATRRITHIKGELKALEKETLVGMDHAEKVKALEKDLKDTEKRLEALDRKWKAELDVANRILEARLEIHKLHEQDPKNKDIAKKVKELKDLEKQFTKAQADEPLVSVAVTGQTISEVISGWTGIPVGRMMADEIATVLNMENLLKERIIGQDHALAAVAQMIQTAHAGIDDPSKPTAVFMFVGTSGVGKTETALALSELLYGGEENVITINMSEYQEAHTVSSLKGSPPGYVGYGEGGVLTEAVRRRPYSVVLLDEVEKAHPDVLELFYQVFDKGRMEDGEGREIDFKNTLIILTSNTGTDTIMKACADEETRPGPDALVELVRPELVKVFKPAFMGRLKVVPFYPITDEIMRLITRLKLNRIKKRMMANSKVTLEFGDEIVDSIAKRCTEVDSGARNVDHILTNTLLPEMSKEILTRMARGQEIRKVKVAIEKAGFGFAIS